MLEFMSGNSKCFHVDSISPVAQNGLFFPSLMLSGAGKLPRSKALLAGLPNKRKSPAE